MKTPLPITMWMSRLSLRHHLVLITVVTVGAVIGIHDVAAYRALRGAATQAATDRLRAAALQVGQLLDAQSAQMRGQVGAVARDSAVAALLRAPTNDSARRRALAVLQPLAVPAGSVEAVEIADASGKTVLSTSAIGVMPEGRRRDVLATVSGNRQAALTPLLVAGDSVFYAAVARVPSGTSASGYVVQWRRITGNERGRAQLVDLIGPGSDISVGNTAGSGWTDFMRSIPRPPLALPQAGTTWYKRGNDGDYLALTHAVAGTPWTLILEFSGRSVMSGVGSLVERLALTTLLLLAIGVAAAWYLARRLTSPLAELAGAAAGISAGDYERRVAVRGTHEVRALGSAFNAMSESIAAAHRVLEERSEELAERAAQLSDQATELEMTNEELADAVDDAVRTRDDLSSTLAENARVTAELDASLAGAPVGIAFHNVDGRYRRVNGSLAMLNGAEPAAHVGRLPSDVAPGFGSVIELNVRRALDTAAPLSNVELSGETPARPGVVQHWLASFYPIRTADGDLIGAGSVVADLTAYKRLESQLVQSQKMEAVGRLAGGVAHDFNNVLTAITGFGQFALSSLNGESENARADLQQVLAAAERAGSLTRQLLAFSRQQVLQPRVIDLNVVVNELSPMLARLIGEDVRLIARPAAMLRATKADPGQIEQVLVNLVVNARDAMPEGGTLVIETANVELDAGYAATREGVVPGPHVMLAVTDTGVGMDAATRARVFDPFFTTKAPGKGTGLGLATVYGIVKQSGGSIDLYSEPGRGSTFKVYLPRSDGSADAQRAPLPGAAMSTRDRLTVLLVDDDPFVAAAGRRTLERAGYNVLVASNGRQALGIMDSHGGPFDVLVTDLVMPEMGGRELARRVTTARPSVRVLFTSGYTAEAMNQQAVLEPGDVFLGKPFTPDSLLRTVHELIDVR